mgnify:CR=1 FL=1
MSKYTIHANNDARMTALDRSSYDTLEAAEADLRRVGPDDLVLVKTPDGGTLLAYADQADADADADGAAAHLSIAAIERVDAARTVEEC